MERTITPRARTMLERTQKDAIRCQYMENLKQKPDQGEAFEVTYIVVTNEDWKKIIMVDVTVPFENRTPAFTTPNLESWRNMLTP
ncbi:hypothetical protein UY3_08075 [Chelonia mydas]|uniref:Uncharacterized protein n=1 Tax=Chelonia mydas TaxID=8469 RepID=M7BRR3_CHEMY|nr:hypothetical protein UY3_08075 [Chelonia mydas]